MPYLSRIFLNPARRQARRLLTDPQAMHAAVLAGLPAQPVMQRVLWRLDTDNALRPGLFVLTQTLPSWEHLTEQAGWPQADDPTNPQVLVRDYQPLLGRLTAGMELAFRLTANPSQSSRRPELLTAAQKERATEGILPRSTRLGHRTQLAQTEWLLTRANGWGFEIPGSSASDAVGAAIPDLRITAKARTTFRRVSSAARVVIQVVTYEGRLRVLDQYRLGEAMQNGLGPAKAYGCGLLTLAPLDRSPGRSRQ